MNYVIAQHYFLETIDVGYFISEYQCVLQSQFIQIFLFFFQHRLPYYFCTEYTPLHSIHCCELYRYCICHVTYLKTVLYIMYNIKLYSVHYTVQIIFQSSTPLCAVLSILHMALHHKLCYVLYILLIYSIPYHFLVSPLKFSRQQGVFTVSDSSVPKWAHFC